MIGLSAPAGTRFAMAVLRLFAAAREAAGTRRATIPGKTVGEVLDAATKRYGRRFAGVVKTSKIWRNGEPTTRDAEVGDADEIAVLPPVSGGAGGTRSAATKARPKATRRLRRGWIGLRPSGPRPARKGGRPSKPRRYAPIHDVDGPKIRLGLIWFALNIAALAVGLELLVPVYAATAGLAARQTALAWRQHGTQPDWAIAAIAAAALPVAAAFGNSMMGLALVLLAGAAVAQAFGSRTARSVPLVDAGSTVQSALFVGLACASVVLCYRYDAGLAVGLLVLAAAYDAGDYLVGSGSTNRVEGPIAAAAAVLCCTFTLAVVEVAPFAVPDGFVYGAVAAVLAIMGPLLASAILPVVDAHAPALRRVDSLLLLAPAWALVVSSIAG